MPQRKMTPKDIAVARLFHFVARASLAEVGALLGFHPFTIGRHLNPYRARKFDEYNFKRRRRIRAERIAAGAHHYKVKEERDGSHSG